MVMAISNRVPVIRILLLIFIGSILTAYMRACKYRRPPSARVVNLADHKNGAW
jgi:hypothetical protein